MTEYDHATNPHKLHAAILIDDEHAAHRLIDAMSDVDEQSADGATAMYLVASGCPDEMALRLASHLLAVGADPARQVVVGAGGHRTTSLHAAVAAGNVGLASLLADVGASANVVMEGGVTALHTARSADMVNVLVSAGADVGAKDNAGKTPLHWMTTDPLCQPAAVTRLLDLGADPDACDHAGVRARPSMDGPHCLHAVFARHDARLLSQHLPGVWHSAPTRRL